MYKAKSKNIPLEEIDFMKYISVDNNNIFRLGRIEYLRLDNTFPNTNIINADILIHILKRYPEIKYVMIIKDVEVSIYVKSNERFDRTF